MPSHTVKTVPRNEEIAERLKPEISHMQQKRKEALSIYVSMYNANHISTSKGCGRTQNLHPQSHCQ